MLEFIKRNKMFSGCLIFCIVVIIILSSLILIKDISGDDNVIVIPPIKDEPNIEKNPEINLFTGTFSDETDTIHITWDYVMNGHTFQKVELYHDDQLMKTLYSERSYDVSIYEYGLCTGDNEIELRLYYDNGIIENKTVDIFVDYVFDLNAIYQLMDNNLGKGYLLTFSYSYNTNTPVGVPLQNATKITTEDKTPFYWKWEYINWESNETNGEYQNTKIYYFISIDDIANEEVTWNLDVKLDSVGVRFEDSFTENAYNVTPIKENIKLK